TQAPPQVLPLRAAFLSRDYAVLAKVSLGCPPLEGRFLRVPHPSPACHQLVLLLTMFPLDLHVLGVPPAFNLSHDQTLHFFKTCMPTTDRSVAAISFALIDLGKRAHISLFQIFKELCFT